MSTPLPSPFMSLSCSPSKSIERSWRFVFDSSALLTILNYLLTLNSKCILNSIYSIYCPYGSNESRSFAGEKSISRLKGSRSKPAGKPAWEVLEVLTAYRLTGGVPGFPSPTSREANTLCRPEELWLMQGIPPTFDFNCNYLLTFQIYSAIGRPT